LNKSALLLVVLAVAGFGLVSCGKYNAAGSAGSAPPSKITERVLASQSVSSATAAGGLVIINGQFDTLGAGGISAGTSPGLMAISPQRSVLLAFDLATNKLDVVNTAKETLTGTIQLPGSTTSIVVPQPAAGYAAVPSAAQNGTSAGAVVALNLTSGGITATISVPNAQTVVSNPNGTQVLAFSNDSDSLTAIYPALLNTASPDTVTVPLCSGCRPVNAVFSSDGSTAYILNCGAECGGTHTSVQILNMTTTPPTPGASVPVDGATIGVLSGSTLYVAGNSPTNSVCTGEATAATTCGRLDLVDLNSMTVTGSAVITDGYHDRIDMGNGGQLFIGSMDCTNVGNVNNVAGEVRGCLTIYNTTNGRVVIPPDNGDVTGLQSFTSRFVEYVAEGGNLRVYDLYTDALLPPNQYVETGTIIIPGFITDVKAIDFF